MIEYKAIVVINVSAFLIGIALLGINLTGLFVDEKPPGFGSSSLGAFKNDVTLTYDEVESGLPRAKAETIHDYVARVNALVNQGLAHYWPAEQGAQYQLNVPLTENYVLYLLQYLKPQLYQTYQYADYDKALRRGVGLCSQHAMILTGILNDHHIDAEILGLEGHVVVTVQDADGAWFVADPDYGIVIPYDIQTLERRPDTVKAYYAGIEASYRPSVESISLNRMIGIYGKAGNEIRDHGVRGYVGWKAYYMEGVAYVLKWLVPVLLLLPCLVSLVRRRLAGTSLKTA